MKRENYFIPVAILILIVINLGLIFSSPDFESEQIVSFEFSVEMEDMKSMEEMHSMEDEHMKHMIHSFVESGHKNPELRIMKGETVIVSFKNTDSMQHNFVIPDLGLETEILDPGQSEELYFNAKNSGKFEYFCSLHPEQMKGSITIYT